MVKILINGIVCAFSEGKWQCADSELLTEVLQDIYKNWQLGNDDYYPDRDLAAAEFIAHKTGGKVTEYQFKVEHSAEEILF